MNKEWSIYIGRFVQLIVKKDNRPMGVHHSLFIRSSVELKIRGYDLFGLLKLHRADDDYLEL